ncbi:Uncharacterized protein GBIM_19892 [Gryllus bimaculatus]|nr:Uncharacterized protein GBIM_19892 [Gryllus bimaculatus]
MVSLKVQKSAACAWFAMALLTVAASATHARHHFHRQKKLVEHNARQVMRLKERGPQPRVVGVAPALHLKSSEMVEPWLTVLHRCDEVACCAFSQMPGQRCLPKQERVTLYFRAIDITSKTWRIIQHEFFNHTECACRAVDHGP